MDNQPQRLAESIYSSKDEKEAEQQVKQLIGLLPSLAERDLEVVTKKMSGCTKDTYWKKRLAGSVIESAIAQKPSPENPLSIGIKFIFDQYKILKWSGIEFIPSIIQAIVLFVVLLLFLVLWIYGLTPVVAGSLWKLIRISHVRMKFMAKNVIEKMPYTMAIGIYFLVWLPFAVLCLPFVIVGWIGSIISSESS